AAAEDHRRDRLGRRDARRERDGGAAGGRERRGGERAAPGGGLLRRRGRGGGVRAPDGRVVDLARGERQRREAERRRGRRRRGRRPAAPEGQQAERHLARGVEVEEPVQLVVDEAEHDAGGQIHRGRHGEQVREQRAVVPEAVPGGA